jgi:hypothetical protein
MVSICLVEYATSLIPTFPNTSIDFRGVRCVFRVPTIPLLSLDIIFYLCYSILFYEDIMSMVTLRSQKIIIYFLTLVFFIPLTGSSKGFVLCFGSDGHIDIETTFNGYDCGHYSPFPLKKTTSSYSKKDTIDSKGHCNSCIDIPLSTDYSLRKIIDTTRSRPTKVKAPLISALLCFPFYPTKIPSRSSSLKFLANISPIHNSIQSVVLLF